MTEELKQAARQALMECPFCGSEPHDAHHIEYGRWAVTCRCGAKGASANTGPNATDAAKIKAYSDARTAWNTRALNQRPAAQTWDKNADVCKGAWELGTACGTCAKCIATKPAQRPAAQTEREAFEAFVLEWTGRDMRYHEQAGTWGLGVDSFEYACWLRAPLSVPQQATPEPVLTVEKEPDYWSNGHFYEGNKPYISPMKVRSLPIGTKLYTRPARGVPEDVQRNAARWEEVLRQVGADRQCGGFRFTLYNLRPIPGSNPMQGAVCQHFTQAVDAALAAAQAKK